MTPTKRPLFFASSVWLCAILFAILHADIAQSPVTRPSRGPTAHADTSMFAPSSDCLACHNNLVAPSGEDVSIGASWRSSMMANAARDPVRSSQRAQGDD